jgi:hypothetical protein
MRDHLTRTLNLFSSMRRILCTHLPFALLLLALTLPIGSAYAAIHGAIYTTDVTGTVVNQNIYPTSTDVYLSGGPQNMNAAGLTDGTYYFQITDPSGKVLLSSDNASCRQLVVSGGRVTGASPAAGACAHTDGTFNPANGATPVQMAPFTQTPNVGDEFKAWLIAQTSSTSISTTDPRVIIFKKSDSKTDNFKTLVASVPVGSCQPSSSLSVLVSGSNVTSYIPKGDWSATPVTGVSVINVEGSSITPTLIPTANVVNSCASNPTTGVTVCASNLTDVYLLAGTALSTTLTDSGVGLAAFSGGACTTCGVAMDATHDKAVLTLNVGPGNLVGGFQYLDLSTSTFEPAFASQAPASGFTNISEDILIDPIRNLILSPDEGSNYELVNVATTTSPAFFENPVVAETPFLDSAGEDCSTGIALASDEESSGLYIADLTQAIFTSGAPGTWNAPSQFQTLAGATLTAGTSGLAVAQGTHTGIVSGEFGGDAITAIALPTTSGIGVPAISDWVTCSIGSGFSNGFDPHSLTAYQSPNGGDAIGLLVNGGASTVAVVDLTKMLNATIVPRTGNVCTSGTLPATVVSFISVP